MSRSLNTGRGGIEYGRLRFYHVDRGGILSSKFSLFIIIMTIFQSLSFFFGIRSFFGAERYIYFTYQHVCNSKFTSLAPRFILKLAMFESYLSVQVVNTSLSVGAEFLDG